MSHYPCLKKQYIQSLLIPFQQKKENIWKIHLNSQILDKYAQIKRQEKRKISQILPKYNIFPKNYNQYNQYTINYDLERLQRIRNARNIKYYSIGKVSQKIRDYRQTKNDFFEKNTSQIILDMKKQNKLRKRDGEKSVRKFCQSKSTKSLTQKSIFPSKITKNYYYKHSFKNLNQSDEQVSNYQSYEQIYKKQNGDKSCSSKINTERRINSKQNKNIELFGNAQSMITVIKQKVHNQKNCVYYTRDKNLKQVNDTPLDLKKVFYCKTEKYENVYNTQIKSKEIKQLVNKQLQQIGRSSCKFKGFQQKSLQKQYSKYRNIDNADKAIDNEEIHNINVNSRKLNLHTFFQINLSNSKNKYVDSQYFDEQNSLAKDRNQKQLSQEDLKNRNSDTKQQIVTQRKINIYKNQLRQNTQTFIQYKVVQQVQAKSHKQRPSSRQSSKLSNQDSLQKQQKIGKNSLLTEKRSLSQKHLFKVNNREMSKLSTKTKNIHNQVQQNRIQAKLAQYYGQEFQRIKAERDYLRQNFILHLQNRHTEQLPYRQLTRIKTDASGTKLILTRQAIPVSTGKKGQQILQVNRIQKELKAIN